MWTFHYCHIKTQCSSLPPGEVSARGAILESEEALTRPEFDSTFILDFPVFRIVNNRFLLLINYPLQSILLYKLK
jgi:hypothetical protein